MPDLMSVLTSIEDLASPQSHVCMLHIRASVMLGLGSIAHCVYLVASNYIINAFHVRDKLG